MKFLVDRSFNPEISINSIKRNNLAAVQLDKLLGSYVYYGCPLIEIEEKDLNLVQLPKENKKTEDASQEKTGDTPSDNGNKQETPSAELKSKKFYEIASTFVGDLFFDEPNNCICANAQGFVHISEKKIKIISPFIISDNQMSIYFVLPGTNRSKFSQDLFFTALRDLHSPLISEDSFKSILSSDTEGISTLASGKEPVHGQCEKIFPMFDDVIKPGEVDEKGNINFFERNFLRNFKKGETIAKIIPEIIPVNGNDVFGKEIKAQYDNNPSFLAGENVVKEQNFLVVSKDGVLSLTGKVINIHDMVKISGDVSLYTGNISTESSVIITGSITENISVETKGDLFVMGTISQPSKLSVKGNLFAFSGIIGRKDSNYQVGGELFTKYMQNCNMTIKGNAIIEEEILNCHLRVNKDIICYSKKGVILSSEIKCAHDIVCKDLGNEHGSKNIIYLGYSYLAEENEKQINEIVKKLEKIQDEKTRLFKFNMLELFKQRIDLKKVNYNAHLIITDFLFPDNEIIGTHDKKKIETKNQRCIYFYKEKRLTIAYPNESLTEKINNKLENVKSLKNMKDRLYSEKVFEKNAKPKTTVSDKRPPARHTTEEKHSKDNK